MAKTGLVCTALEHSGVGGATLQELAQKMGLNSDEQLKSLLEGLIKEGRVFFTQSTGKYNLVSPFDEFDGVL